MQNAYLGIDVGSVTTKCALIDENGNKTKETITNPDGSVSVIEFDEETGILAKETVMNPDGSTVEREFDENENVTEETVIDPDKTKTVSEFDKETGKLKLEDIYQIIQKKNQQEMPELRISIEILLYE